MAWLWHRRPHPWKETSLQTRITALTVGLISGGLLLSGLGTHVMLSNYLFEQIDQQLTTTATALAQSDVADLQTVTKVLPTQYYAIAFADSGAVLVIPPANTDSDDIPSQATLRKTLSGKALETPYTVTVASGASWRFVNLQISTSIGLVVGIPITSATQTLTQYTNIFIGFGLLVLIAGGGSAWFLAGSLFAPLRRAENAAASIAGGDYTKRLPDASSNTEIGRLNHSLNIMTDRIEASFDQRAKTIDQMRRFVSDASHELRTPLVSVRGYAELYRMGALDTPEDVAQAMDRIEREAIRMAGLVEDLLALARLDETRPLESAVVDMRLIAHDIALDAMARDHDREVELVEWRPSPSDTPPPPPPAEPEASPHVARASTGRIRITRRGDRTSREAIAASTSPPPPPPATTDESAEPLDALVWGEENKLRQVLTNIVVNALRYTPAGSPLTVAVGVDRARSRVVVEVRDHGPGIPEQLRGKIFQRFFRADNSRTRDTGGSGLGLAIVAAIVAAHRGEVRALETPGGGATFRVALPLYREK